MEFVETLKVNANYLTVYNTIIDGKKQTRTFDTNFVDTFHDCRMSSAAVKTIKKAVNVILYLARRQHFAQCRRNAKVSCTGFRQNEISTKQSNKQGNEQKQLSDYMCSFLTLTLPSAQTHSDTELTEFAINPFLSYCRKMWGVRYYIWKKELQKNGNVHFHLVTDRYIKWNYLREAWNRIINRGIVKDGCAPFDYVDRYTAKMKERFADGWNVGKMFELAKKSPYVQQSTDDKVADIEKKENRKLTNEEYNYIYLKEAQKEYRKMFAAYNAEMKLPEADRWTSPNSTDISAIHSPKSVSVYVAKYIAKDIDGHNSISTYQQKVDTIKTELKAKLKYISDLLQEGENVPDVDREVVEITRQRLEEARTECPIKGRLWFKSATLTPFLTGATNPIDTAIYTDLVKLTNYLRYLESKDKKKYIVHSYELDEYGQLNYDEHGNVTNKVICTTLLFNVFSLLMQRNKNGSYKYPEIATMWYKFVNDCVKANKARGLYEVSDKEMKNIKVLTKINGNAVKGIK